MSIFKRSRKYGTVLLALWLIAWGLLPLSKGLLPFANLLMMVLAIAAGVLILIDR